MAKTIQEIRQELTALSAQIDYRTNDPALSEHDLNNLKFAADKIDAARKALFDCEVQS